MTKSQKRKMYRINHARWLKKQPGGSRGVWARYYIKNREKCIERSHNWKLKNPERYKQLQDRWFKLHRKQIRKKQRERSFNYYHTHFKNNPEKVACHLLQRRLSYQKRGYVYICMKRWKENNKDKTKIYNHKRLEMLVDSVVRQKLSNGSCVKPKEWPQSLVELRRQLTKTRRAQREIRCKMVEG